MPSKNRNRSTSEEATITVMGVEMQGASIDAIWRACEQVCRTERAGTGPGAAAGNSAASGTTNNAQQTPKKSGRKPMSAEARLKLSKALKARHAAQKKGKAAAAGA
jgi:hypothetical protein